MSNIALYSRRAAECEQRAATKVREHSEISAMWTSLRDDYLFLLSFEERKEADLTANRW
jgi:hypothetical protein